MTIPTFPKINLSYEIKSHTKDSDIYLLIPSGKKTFAWFINDVCYLTNNCLTNNENNEKKQIKVNIVNNGLNGTILYGTSFKHNGFSYFCIEDIYYHKHRNVSKYNYQTKLEIISNILSNEIFNHALDNTYTIFGVPIMTDTYVSTKVSYDVSYIQGRYLNSAKILHLNKINDINGNGINGNGINANGINGNGINANGINGNGINANGINGKEKRTFKSVFKIGAEIERDIYKMYMIKDNVETFYTYLHIPNYDTSVMMNSCFRNIKENRNLDLLEESDDEDEFQNNAIDKYVDINKTELFLCEYNHKFKRWKPLHKITKNVPIISYNIISHLKIK